jgi:fatty acid desaturase
MKQGWLQKILTPPGKTTGGQARKTGFLVQLRDGNLPSNLLKGMPRSPEQLPNATVIYGIGASFLFVASLFLLIGGRWFPALIVFAIGLCLVGFALHLLKHQD